MVRIYRAIKKSIFEWRVRKAVKKADKMATQTKLFFLVLNYKGHPVVKSRTSLKKQIKAGKYKKGVTIETLEKIAIYKTYNLCPTL